MILSVFNCDKTKGCLYIEAHNMAHVQAFITGITGIWKKGVEMIPYPEMPQVLKVCSEVSQTALKVHQWVRIKSGVYEGDLGLVESIQGGGGVKAFVRLVPRIEELTAAAAANGETTLKLATKK